VDVPAAAQSQAGARLLDRNGHELAVPLTASVRDDADGSHWLTTELALAPFAPGDYVIEITSGSATPDVVRTLVAFRVVP
jgi:hypothetical protein